MGENKSTQPAASAEDTKTQKQSQPRQEASPPDEDPNSELNVLRREVRQLQAAVRDAALQAASQEDEIATLRKALAAAEADVDRGLAREARLHARLDNQQVHRQRLETTVAAAEALVTALRDMAIDSAPSESLDASEPYASDKSEPLLHSPAARFQSKGQPDLDLVLSRISDSADNIEDQLQASRDGLNSVMPSHSDTLTAQAMSESSIPRRHSIPISMRLAHTDTASTKSPISASTQPPVDVTGLMGPLTLLRSAFGASKKPLPATSVSSAQPLINENESGTLNTQSPTSSMDGSGNSTVTKPVEINTTPNRKAPAPIKNGLPSRPRRVASSAHGGDIFALTSSKDGRWLASSGDDRTIRLYELFTGASAVVAETPKATTAVAFATGDGSVVLSGSSDGVIRAFRRGGRRHGKWQAETVFPVHTQSVRQMLTIDNLEFGNISSASAVLSCSTDRTIKLSDIEKSRRPFTISTPSAVLDVDMFPTRHDGLIVSAHKDGSIRTWSLHDPSVTLGDATVHAKPVTSVTCLDDGFGVVSLGRDSVLRLSDIRMSLSVVRDIASDLAVVSDWHRATARGRHAICGRGSQGDLSIWNVDTGKLVRAVSCQIRASEDVLGLVTSKLHDPGCITIPHWTSGGMFASASRSRQVLSWELTPLDANK